MSCDQGSDRKHDDKTSTFSKLNSNKCHGTSANEKQFRNYWNMCEKEMGLWSTPTPSKAQKMKFFIKYFFIKCD